MGGVSAGAIISAYYAAVGLSVNEMIGLAPVFRGVHQAALQRYCERVLCPHMVVDAAAACRCASAAAAATAETS